MSSSIHSRLKTLLAAAMVAAGMAMPAWADIVYGCFTVVPYSVNWHVKCTLDGFTDAVDFAIDDNKNNGWRVVDHGSRRFGGLSAVEYGEVVNGEVVNAETFIEAKGLIEFPNQSDFIVGFVIGCSSTSSIDGYFGWVHLAYEGGTIVLKGGAINTERGAALVAGIEEPSCDLDWQTVDRGDYLDLAANCIPSDASGRVVLPREINGKPVTSIGENAFYGCRQITSLIIPNSISNIGYKAFSGCMGITLLSVPSSVTNLGASAFFDCNYLKTLSLHGPATIVSNAVWGLPQLQSIEFGAGVRTICGGAVYGCLHLTSLTISGDVERIEPGAFTLCENLSSVSVHWLTKADASSFPQGCEITRYGIDHLPARPYYEPPLTDAEMLQFVDIVGRDALVGRSWLSWSTRPSDDESLKGMDRACVRLGLYPTSFTTYSGPNRHFYFGRPKISVLEFDHAKRFIKMKVNPPEGSHVAAKPMLEYIHLIAIFDLANARDSEFEVSRSDVSIDLSGYMTSGEFSLTYPETGAQFFYLRIGDE